MPKVALRYVGNDEKYAKSLEATNGVVFMEPVDAREVLASGNEDYEVDEDQRALIGQVYDPGAMADLNIPQLQGDDAELMAGHSADKYRRSAVVKAVPNGSVPTSSRPTTTTGRPLSEKAQKAAAAEARKEAEEEESTGSEGSSAPAKTTRRKR